jgi:diaminopimelate epimerase
MRLSFTKMTGAGNDFVMIDNRSGALKLTTAQISHLCNRNFGVGGDGLMLTEPGTNGADFYMRYYNADGSEAEMCGNGARCFAKFSSSLSSTTHNPPSALSFDTPAGRIRASFEGEEVTINMTSPQNLKLGQKVSTSAGEHTVHSLNTGVPHAVIFVPEVEKVEIKSLGRELRFHAAFQPKGTNVNFAQLTGGNTVRVRTYERGVEDETLACGTGVVATAILSHEVNATPLPVTIRVQGGPSLKVNFTKTATGYENVTLSGPATVCFTGEIEI